MYSNVDSLFNKKDELEVLIADKNYDVIALTEIFPKNQQLDYTDNIWNINGYTLHYPADKTFTARGCIIFTKDTLKSFQIDSRKMNFIEHIQVGIQTNTGSNILISCIYRSPSATSDECILELAEVMGIKKYYNTKFDCILHMGDFNFKEINWQLQSTTVGNEHLATRFLETVMDLFLIQHVRQPTRYRGDNIPSVLDLILTNEEGMIETIDHCAPIGSSDHEVLEFKYVYRNVNDVYRPGKFCYFKGNYEEINKELENVDWENLLARGSIEDLWTRFADKLSNISEKNIPVSKSKPKNYDTPWMNPDTLSAIQLKRKMWKKYKYCRNPQNKERYNQAKAVSSQKVREAQAQYEKTVALKSKEDPKAFWKYVQSKTKVKESIQCIIDQGVIYSDNEHKADLLNKFFHSVFISESDTDNLPNFVTRTNQTLENVEITETIVKKHLNKIKESKSQGSDGIHPKLIKETVTSITKPVTKIYTKSMEESKLPQIWKVANITPIHKKGPKTDVSNYRPISLTSIICKTMERIVRDTLMDYMEDNNFFTNHQHGFRKGRSCVTQLIEVIEKWTDKLDNQNDIDVIYLDFQKAFDTVPHNRLILKLKGYGITGNILHWIKDFLSDRKQRVVLNGTHSTWTNVTSGIPQGSVLGPILFIIYINDLPDAIHNFVKLFADDTKLFATVNNIDDKNSLQSDINQLLEWSQNWLLKFNNSKCKHVHLGPNSIHRYTMSNTVIEKSEEEKDLGIIIDSKLQFQQHINAQVKKANQKVGIINRTFKYMDKDMFLTLYKSLVRPHLEYGSTVWAVINKKEAILIENVQRRATRLIREIQHLSYGDRLKYLGLPSLQYRRLRADMVETYKIFNDIDKVDKSIFPVRESRTRGHKHKIFKKHSRTNRRKYSFSQRVVDHWNALPTDIVEAKSVNIFKSVLNAHWKNFPIKFVPDFYGPEAGITVNTIEMGQRGSQPNH